MKTVFEPYIKVKLFNKNTKNELAVGNRKNITKTCFIKKVFGCLEDSTG